MLGASSDALSWDTRVEATVKQAFAFPAENLNSALYLMPGQTPQKPVQATFPKPLLRSPSPLSSGYSYSLNILTTVGISRIESETKVIPILLQLVLRWATSFTQSIIQSQ